MPKEYSDPYAVLGLDQQAGANEIKQAYFAQVREHPPERDAAAFKLIRAAYEKLRDPARRVETDMLLLQEWPAPARRRRAPKLDLRLHEADVLLAARALSDLERTDWHDQFGKIEL